MASRFVAPLAQEAAFASSTILLLGLAAFLAGLYVFAAFPLVEFQMQNSLLFVTLLFFIPTILTLMLKSFRKVLIALAPAAVALALTSLTLYVLQLRVTGSAGLFASLAFAISISINFILARHYFDERRRPTTAINALRATYDLYSKVIVGLYVLMIVTFLSLVSFTTGETGSLGAMTALGLFWGLVTTIFFLPAVTVFYEHRASRKALSPLEQRLLPYAESFGHHKENHLFFASWLGTAIEDIENSIENLRGKGFLGANFFIIDDPLVWFFLLSSFVLGAAMSKTFAPTFGEIGYGLGVLLALTIGICLQAHQSLQFLDLSVRRLLGLILIAVSLFAASTLSGLFLQLAAVLAVLGLLSVIISTKPYWVVSNLTVSAYFALVFAAGWSLFDVSFSTDAKLWALGIAILVFVVQLVTEEEGYVFI